MSAIKLGPARRRGTKTANLPRFPQWLVEATRCGNRINDPGFYTANTDGYGYSHPNHSTHSETAKQRGYLHALAKRAGYRPPPETCCINQARVQTSYLLYKLSDKHRTRTRGSSTRLLTTPTT